MKNPFKIKFLKLNSSERQEIEKLHKKVQTYSQEEVWNKSIRKNVKIKCNNILKRLGYEMDYPIEEFCDYDLDGLIDFIHDNIPFNLKLSKDREDFTEYKRLQKKFRGYKIN